MDVALVARSRDALEALKKEIEAKGRKAVAIPADLADPAAAQPAIEAAVKALGRLDLLVNCAGATKGGSFLRFADSRLDRQLRPEVLHCDPHVQIRLAASEGDARPHRSHRGNRRPHRRDRIRRGRFGELGARAAHQGAGRSRRDRRRARQHDSSRHDRHGPAHGAARSHDGGEQGQQGRGAQAVDRRRKDRAGGPPGGESRRWSRWSRASRSSSCRARSSTSTAARIVDCRAPLVIAGL